MMATIITDSGDEIRVEPREGGKLTEVTMTVKPHGAPEEIAVDVTLDENSNDVLRTALLAAQR